MAINIVASIKTMARPFSKTLFFNRRNIVRWLLSWRILLGNDAIILRLVGEEFYRLLYLLISLQRVGNYTCGISITQYDILVDLFDNLLSEEGGRFLHEQNRNILIRTDLEKLPELPEGYFLVDFRTLNDLVQINNMLNIQLRNLLSLLEA